MRGKNREFFQPRRRLDNLPGLGLAHITMIEVGSAVGAADPQTAGGVPLRVGIHHQNLFAQ